MAAHDPHEPAEYDEAVIMAVQALDEGRASESQQKLFRDWFLHAVCRVDDMSFRTGGEDGRRATDFCEGRRFPANQYRKMLNPITLAALKQREGRRKSSTRRQEK